MKDSTAYLDRNEFNFRPSPLVEQALRDFDPLKLCFYTRIYDEGKKSIFSVYLSELYSVPEEQVLLGYGAEDLLKQTVHFFLGRKAGAGVMMIPKFSWWYYKSLADEVGGRTYEYPLYEEDDTFSYDFDTLASMAAELKPDLLLLASPNNPTGNGLTPGQLDAVMDSVPQSTVVVVDEAYASFVTPEADYIARMVSGRHNIIFVRTLSKFYGLPGLRMGYGFMSAQLKDFTRFSNKYLGYNRISEDIAIAALKSDGHYRHIASLMNQDRRRYEEEIGQLPGFKVYRSVSNFILVKYPAGLKAKLQDAFRQENYKVKFMNEPDINSHMRITLGRPDQNAVVIDTIKRIAGQA